MKTFNGAKSMKRTTSRKMSARIHWILAAVITTGAFLAGASPSLAADTFVTLVSSENGKCLQPVNGGTNPGDAIVQETCNGSATQLWQVSNISSSVVHFINSASHLCLDARGGAANGTPIQQWTCDQITNLNWRVNASNKFLQSAVSNTSSHCIATPGNQDGLAMHLEACSKTPAQFWLQGGSNNGGGTPCKPTPNHPCP
jgi:hypothetical protein